jgi:hypothetical protein
MNTDPTLNGTQDDSEQVAGQELTYVQPEKLTSQQIFELLKSFEGREIAPGVTWSIGRRKPYEAVDGTIINDKGMSTEVKNGRFLTFAPGEEHPGYGLYKLRNLTIKSLLTLIRHGLNQDIMKGETKGSKTEDYKDRQELVTQEIIRLATRAANIGEDAVDEEKQEYAEKLDEATQVYLGFMYEDVRETISEDDEHKAVESFTGLLKFVAELNAKGQA